MASTTATASTSPTSTSTAEPSCVTVAPGKNGYIPSEACNANWNFDPSYGAAIFFTIAFGVSALLHIGQAVYYKKLKLSWVIIMGVIWEFASFLLRAIGSRHQDFSAYAVSSQILVLLAPLWINAFLYMVLGRMVYFFIEAKALWKVKATSITKMFVWLDITSFLVQLGGGVLITPGNSPSTLMTGIHIYMGGIGFQQLCILLFLVLCTRFWIVKRREEGILSMAQKNWFGLLMMIYISLALITIRIIFRLVEFSSGIDQSNNPIPYHEAYFYCLDAAPMLLACWLMNAIHPGRVLVGEGSEFPKGPSRKEKKERKRALKMEKKMLKEERRNAKREQELLESDIV